MAETDILSVEESVIRGKGRDIKKSISFGNALFYVGIRCKSYALTLFS